MTVRTGKCANFGLCAKADAGEVIAVPRSADFKCPVCGKELRPMASNGRRVWKPPAILVVAAVLLVIVGVGTWFMLGRRTTSREPSPSVSATASLLPPSVPLRDKPTIILRMHGSNTIGAQLAPALADAYLRQRGATNVGFVAGAVPEQGMVVGILAGQSRSVGIEIYAKGSTTAFEDLQGGLTDIGMSSRKIKPEEKRKLAFLGDLDAYGAENVLGLDGVAIIVHASNPISNLTRDQVRRVFSGDIADWRDLGGTPGEIHIYSRPPASSGTFDTFNNLVLSPAVLSAAARKIDDSEQLSDAVAQDVNGIGFIGLPYVRSTKALGISDHGTRPLLPNQFTVGREDYLLSRRLYLYAPPKRLTREIQDFLRFSLSESGQAVVERVGFVSQTIKVDPTRSQPDGSNPLNLSFRFRSGSSELDNKALADLDRVVAYARSSSSTQGLLLIGYADNIGSPASNMRLSRDRALAVSEQLRNRGLNVVGETGLGAENPVASNDTNEGREENRRVEIWTRK